MTKVLITGATGNTGTEVIRSLQQIDHKLDLFAGVRDIETGKAKLADCNIKFVQFDFINSKDNSSALNGCEILFLLRPPQISNVDKYIKPVIESCKEQGVKHIVFLSVQGVEKSKFIPHHKIEKLITESKIKYTFLPPAYFMQNFTTTLHHDLVNKKRIFLPAGNEKFTLVDVRDIGAVSAKILANISGHVNKAYDLTGNKKLTFSEMAIKLSSILGIEIKYTSPTLIDFFLVKRKDKTPVMFILVMIMLHYLPRFQQEPETSDWVEKILLRQPVTFEEFIKDNMSNLTN